MDEPLRVVLASSSPQRLELLTRLGLEVDVRPADLDERRRRVEAPDVYVRRLAVGKAMAVDTLAEELVIAGDTVVVLDDDVLGKPDDAAHAHALLRRLSGRPHDVLTGVAVRRDDEVAAALARTRVWFRHLSHEELDWYVATGEPLDKAGGYGIQGAGAALVERIEGSDTNVVGLPLPLVITLARRLGVDLLSPRPAA